MFLITVRCVIVYPESMWFRTRARLVRCRTRRAWNDGYRGGAQMWRRLGKEGEPRVVRGTTRGEEENEEMVKG